MYTNPTFLASSDDRWAGSQWPGPEFHWPNSTTGIAVCEAIGRETRAGNEVDYGNSEVACSSETRTGCNGDGAGQSPMADKMENAKVKPRELRRVSHLGAWPRGLGRCWLGIVRLVAVAGIPVEIIGGLHHPHSSQPLIDFASERFTAIPQLVLSLV